MNARVAVMSRVGCPGCDEAVAEVRRVCEELAVSWEVCDVDTDPEWRAEYGDHVPVILVDGAEHGFWQVEPERLRRALG